MLVETTHPRTGNAKVVEMTKDEYDAIKILSPYSVRIVNKTVVLRINAAGSSLSIAAETIPDYWTHPQILKKAGELLRLPRIKENVERLNVANVDVFTYDTKANDIAANVPVSVLVDYR